VTRNAAVVGSPISHSLSPALHRAAYAALGLDWVYWGLEVNEEQLPDFVDGLDDTWVGLSLTMPLKEAVLDLASEVSWTAQATTSANTLLLPSRKVYNTDVDGLVTALQRGGFAEEAGFDATVLGVGATARSAVAAIHRLGARRVHMLARRPETALPARETAERLGIPVHIHAFDRTEFLDVPLVIATVPPGVADGLSGRVPDSPAWLLDVVYAPWPTRIAEAWTARGGRAVSGLEMLLAQAERQVELMTGLPAPSQAMRAALPTTHD
jgi:shikimate dehydrogenase